MCQEVYELVQEIGLERLELQLVLQCAPLLTGLKASNLLIVKPVHKSLIYELCRETGLSCFKLGEQMDRVVYLLFDQEALARSLSQEAVQKLLQDYGYEVKAPVQESLMRFRRHYASYRIGQQGFPHEMGVFLDYPTEDVEGFIQNAGKNFLFSGYWKVYANVPKKRRLFQLFDQAERRLTRSLSAGVKLTDAVKNCKLELQKAAV